MNRRMPRALPCIVACFAIAGASACARSTPAVVPPEPGESAMIQYSGEQLGSSANPVKAAGPSGQWDFLSRLKCPGGISPSFERYGSFGRAADQHTLDGYDVICAEDGVHAFVFMDMYHPEHRERGALPPFEVLPELPARTAEGCPPRVHVDPDSSASYVFNSLEVETPARLLTPVDSVSYDGPVLWVGFTVGRDGRPEPGSLVFTPQVTDSAREEIAQTVAALRYSPALHHPTCPVRVFEGVEFPLNVEALRRTGSRSESPAAAQEPPR